MIRLERGGAEARARSNRAPAGRARRGFLVASGSLAAAAALAAAWIVLAPASLGGSASYMVIDGVSMEPHLHRGDLVIVRAQASYGVGQVVAYHNLQLGRVVLHRIVSEAGGSYAFKGDNNNFVDFYHPPSSELIGRL